MEYIAIIGDIKESKKIEERNLVQKKLADVLIQTNRIFSTDISALFIITLGDEFQGLLNRSNHLLDIVNYIQREMYPVRLRFGVGHGEISTEIYHEAAIGADGPAYYAARAIIEELREQEKRLKRQAAKIQISMYNRKCLEVDEINLILSFMSIIEEQWTDKQRYTIWDMERNGGSQAECAKRMNTTQSTVARRLTDGNYITYEKARKTVSEAIKRLGEIKGDN